MRKLLSYFLLFMGPCITFKVHAQGGGPDCTIAGLAPVSLPFNSALESTCGMLDDYNGANIKDSCGKGISLYTAGMDKLYAFSSQINGTILIFFSAPAGNDSSSLFVFEGCPDDPAAKCIAANLEQSSNKNMGVTVQSGKSYFLMVDRAISTANDSCILTYSLTIGEPNPFCNQFITRTGNNVDNLDFERGNLNRWKAFTGTCCEINTPNIGAVNGRHTIMTGGGTDPNTGNKVPVVFPGAGKFSARLGNPVNGAEAERLTYKFKVNKRSTCLLYKYAVVLEDPGHDAANQPRFEVKVYDKNNQVINCGYYKVVAGANIPCFTASPSSSQIIYKDWTTVGIDLTPYLGQDITVEYSTGDCGYGGHYGYAYLDVSAIKLQITTIGNYCKGDSQLILVAPPGFAAYKWNTGETTPTIVVNNVAPGTKFTVEVTSIQDNSCISPISIVFDDSTKVTADFSAPASICAADSAYFTDQSTATGTNIDVAQWIWTFGDGDSSLDRNPVHVYKSQGNYSVKLVAVSNLGCTDTIIKTIQVLKTIDAPVPTCISQSLNAITIGWNAVSGAIGYEVSIDQGASWIPPSSGNTGTTHQITGLKPDDSIRVLIRSLDNPPCRFSLPGEVTCSTLPCPKVILTLTASDTTIVQSESSTLSASVTGGVGPYEYTWTPSIGSGPGPFSVSPSETTTYYVTVTDKGANGCPLVSDSVTIYVGCPAALGLLTVTDSLIEQGGTTQVEAMVTGGVGPFKYQWTPNIGNGKGPYTVSPDTTTTYRVIITDLGTKNCPKMVDSVTVYVGCPAAAASLKASDSVVNRGTTALIEVTVYGGVGPFDFEWTPNIGQGRGPHTVKPDSATTYRVVVTDLGTKNCPKLSDEVHIEVVCPPMILTASISDTFIYSGRAVVLKADASGGQGPYRYEWKPVGLNGPGPHTIVPDSTATYTVTVYDEGVIGCPVVSDTLQVRVVKDCIFYFYLPNAFSPNGDEQNDGFKGIGECIAEYSMHIYDRWGKRLFVTANYNKPWNGGLNNDPAKPMPLGAYVYVVNVTDTKNNTYRYIGLVALTE